MPELAPLLTPDRHELVELVRDLHSQASLDPQRVGQLICTGDRNQIQSSVLEPAPPQPSAGACNRRFHRDGGSRHATGELQAVLAEQGQWLPIDPPLAGPSSIGGVVARGVSGPLRHKAMGLKDQVIGISLLRSDGTTARRRAGGEKRGGLRPNAPAHRQLGQLGLITQLTLRTQPLLRTTGSALPQEEPCLPCSSCAKSFCSIAPWPWSDWNGGIKPARSGCGYRW